MSLGNELNWLKEKWQYIRIFTLLQSDWIHSSLFELSSLSKHTIQKFCTTLLTALILFQLHCFGHRYVKIKLSSGPYTNQCHLQPFGMWQKLQISISNGMYQWNPCLPVRQCFLWDFFFYLSSYCVTLINL